MGGLEWRTRAPAKLLLIVIISLAQDGAAMEGAVVRMLRGALGLSSSSCISSDGPRLCSLALTCWARGGRPALGDPCGPAWLFSCCEYQHQPHNNYIEDYRDSDLNVDLFGPPLVPLQETSLQGLGTWRRNPGQAAFRRRSDDDPGEETDCGVAGFGRGLDKRIVGGRAAQRAEFPWQAHLRIGAFQCGGVLVSRWFVATAAHCVQRAGAREIAVWLGALDTRARSPPAERHRVSQKIVHPLFRYRVTQPDRYDLALLRLGRSAVLGALVLPVCLPGRQERSLLSGRLAGRTALVAGWGSTGRAGAPRGTHHLRSAVVPILSTEECILWHQSKQISVEIHSEMMCAGHSDGHQDACLGDSGGPLVIEETGRFYLVGITSAGFGCGVDHQPGIYHNVLVTSQWIQSVIWQ